MAKNCIGVSATKVFFVNHELIGMSGPIDYGDLGTLKNWGTPNLVNVGGSFSLRGNPLEILEIAALKTVGGDLRIFDSLPNNYLSTAQYQALQSVGGVAYLVDNCASIYSLDAPAFVTATGGVRCSNNAVLANINLPVFLPTNGTDGDFSANALTATAVNHVLARYVASAGYVSGTLNLSGGSSAAPTGQGTTDKATLQSRGVTVNTN